MLLTFCEFGKERMNKEFICGGNILELIVYLEVKVVRSLEYVPILQSLNETNKAFLQAGAVR
jgi:hypothetical protein